MDDPAGAPATVPGTTPARGGSTRALPRLLLILAAAFFVARVGTGVVEQGHPSDVKDAIAWREIGDAEALARQTGRPILYEFGAAWCGPCKALQSEVFADPRNAGTIEASFVPVRVTDRQREDGHNPLDVQGLEQRYHIEAFPTLVMVDPDAGELGRLEGYPGASAVMRTLAEASTRYKLKKGQFGTGGIIIK